MLEKMVDDVVSVFIVQSLLCSLQLSIICYMSSMVLFISVGSDTISRQSVIIEFKSIIQFKLVKELLGVWKTHTCGIVNEVVLQVCRGGIQKCVFP